MTKRKRDKHGNYVKPAKYYRPITPSLYFTPGSKHPIVKVYARKYELKKVKGKLQVVGVNPCRFCIGILTLTAHPEFADIQIEIEDYERCKDHTAPSADMAFLKQQKEAEQFINRKCKKGKNRLARTSTMESRKVRCPVLSAKKRGLAKPAKKR